MIEGLRGSGRTREMVTRLPEGGAIIIVHTPAFVSYLREMIIDLRGKDFYSRCKILPVTTSEDLHFLRGQAKPVVFDHAFLERASRDLVQQAKDLAQAAQRRMPPDGPHPRDKLDQNAWRMARAAFQAMRVANKPRDFCLAHAIHTYTLAIEARQNALLAEGLATGALFKHVTYGPDGLVETIIPVERVRS